MRRLGALGVLVIVGSARGDSPPPLTERVIDALTLSDSSATRTDLEAAFAGSAAAVATSLASIAQDTAADVGVQLRAIRGLAQFSASGTVAHDALAQVIVTDGAARSGSPVLILRAAIEAFGALAGGHGQPGDEALLAPHLNDESRDVRASTARSLGQLCDPSAIADLKARRGIEAFGQVTAAIDDAVRALNACPTP